MDPNHDPQLITYSRCEKAGASILSRVRAETTFGVSHIFTASTKIKIKNRPTAVRFPRQSDLGRILKRASKEPVLLFDDNKRRAWLIMLSDAILLMVRREFDLDASALDGEVVVNTLTNLPVKLKGSPVEEYISDSWSNMEVLAEKLESSFRGKLNLRTRHLYGYEFRDVAEQLMSPPKQATLLTSHGGWNPLIRDINALVLFGAEFGDLMRPHPPAVCQQCANLPPGYDYMATCVPTILRLYEKVGEAQTRRHLNNGSPKLQWNCEGSSTLFKPCDQGCIGDCGRRQQIVHVDSADCPPPQDLAHDGAIIFGTASTPRYHTLLITNGHATKRSNLTSRRSPGSVNLSIGEALPSTLGPTARVASADVLKSSGSVTETTGSLPHNSADSYWPHLNTQLLSESAMATTASLLREHGEYPEPEFETMIVEHAWSRF